MQPVATLRFSHVMPKLQPKGQRLPAVPISDHPDHPHVPPFYYSAPFQTLWICDKIHHK